MTPIKKMAGQQSVTVQRGADAVCAGKISSRDEVIFLSDMLSSSWV